jgi:hypothetical protein
LSRRSGAPDLPVIGWSEYVALPEWGIARLRAKVDTGARTSALHVENIEELPRGRICFDVVLHRRKRDRRVHVVARVSRRARVRSSSGHFTVRPFVATRVRVGRVEHDVEFSLVDREAMIHRMLLGRSAIAGHFLVDVAHRSLLGDGAHGRSRHERSGAGPKKGSKKASKKTTRKRRPSRHRA